jgi:hypothetical protein
MGVCAGEEKQERDSRSLGSECVGKDDGTANVLDVISSVLPDLTPEWVCEAAARLRTVLVNLDMNSLVVSDE